jgi:hypothetical protein
VCPLPPSPLRSLTPATPATRGAAKG